MKKLVQYLPILLVLAAVYVALFPKIMESFSAMRQTSMIASYAENLSEKSEAEIEEEWKRATAYNERIYDRWKNSVFTYQGEYATDDEYKSMLVLDSDVMGYIEIPSIDVYLPIAHGTTSGDLDGMAGHMYLSSLPVGGKNTKPIIAAHTGLSQSKLFTDLDKVAMGEYFYLHIYNRILCYQITSIDVCVPEEDFHFLQIEDGKDLVALYTCTPYGINDHRLIVTGEHRNNLDTKIESNQEGAPVEVANKNTRSLIEFILLSVSPAIVTMIGLILYHKFQKNRLTHD